MSKNRVIFFSCFLLFAVLVCRLNYTIENRKESTADSHILKASESTMEKQNNPSNDSERKISMISRKQTYPTSIQEIYVTIQNDTLVEYNTSLGYTIEHFNGSAWNKVPLNFFINYAIVLLHPGESGEFTIYLHHKQYNYKPGRYRICKTVDSSSTVESSSKDTQILTCEFNLK